MIKHFSLLILLSIGLLFLMPYAHLGIMHLLDLHTFISMQLQALFNSGRAGILARELITMLCLPIVISAVITGVYWVVKKQWSPIFLRTLWASWLVQAGILMIIHKMI